MNSSRQFSLIRSAVARWQFTLVMFSLLVVLGIIALFNIPKTEDPTLDPPTFVINAVLPSATPSEIEQLLTRPIEKAVYKLDHLREVRSQSKNSLSTTRVEFVWGTNPEAAYEQLNRELNAIRSSLPKGMQRLEVIKARPLGVAFYQLALTSQVLPYRRLEKLAEDLTDQLGAIPGINEARYWGEVSSEMRVALDPYKMSALGITAPMVIHAVQQGGQESPIGHLVNGKQSYELLYKGAYRDKARLAAVPVRIQHNQIVRLGDIAQVQWAEQEPQSWTRFNGQRGLLVTVTQSKNEDVTRLTAAVDAVVAGFRANLPGDVKLQAGFRQTDNVLARLNLLKRDFLIALGLVCITLLPLGLRAAGVVMVAIPLSLLIGLWLMQQLGYTLNQLAVAGFVVALGLLVDDAIVVVENIARWLRDGHSRLEAAVQGTQQISLAVLGCTACLMFSFLPLLALPEGPGEFIRSLPVAVLTTVAASLLIALTLIPLLASVWLDKHSDSEGNRLLQGLNRGIQRVYSPLLHWSLQHPKKTLASLLMLTLVSIPLIVHIGTSLFPPAETPQFLIRIEATQGTALTATNQLTQKVETILRTLPEIRWFSSSIGRGHPQVYYNIGQREQDSSFAEIAVSLHHWHSGQTPHWLDSLQARLAGIAGARITLVKFVNGPEIEAPVVVRLVGPDMQVLQTLAGKATTLLQQVPGLTSIKNPLAQPSTHLALQVNETVAAGLGVSEGSLRESVQVAVSGVQAANFRDADQDQYPVTVRLPLQQFHGVQVLQDVFVPNQTGELIKLNRLATLVPDSEPARIDRFQRSRAVTITAYVQGGMLVSRATQAVVNTLQTQLTLPPGYRWQLGGEAETQSRSFAGFLPAIVIALLGILAVLVLEFQQLKTVLVVFGIVPFGVMGALVALWLTGQSLSFTASVGLIALIGIEIKNSILLVDFTEQLRAQGLSIREALAKAGELRFLPVLLTSITAIAGLMPLAMENNGLLSPTAITLIGGLIASTLLARIATPVTYLLLAKES